MKSLDLRLYAWLAEPDERRFERAFSAYFAVAFPAVIRHLSRFCRWDPGRLEDLAQEVLLRFFHKAGRGRREASQLVRSALARLRPLELGPFHQRQVQDWTQEVTTFADSAMNFRGEADEAGWKAAIRAILDRIPPLQRQGRHLLQCVRLELRWSVDVQADADPSVEAGGAAIGQFVEQFAAECAARSARAVAAQGRHPGVQPFCKNACVVVDNLPQLRVPTNSYLFQIAQSVYIDDCKSLGRLKRGGRGGQHPENHAHPLESLDDDGELEGHGDEPATLPQVLVIDPASEYEDEEFFLRFHEYLRRPVDRAADDYQRAAAVGSGAAERRRLESLTNKLARTLAVLSAIGEGHTQEQVAEQLGLSRNQVKYIIELVQQAYAKFAADSTPASVSYVP